MIFLIVSHLFAGFNPSLRIPFESIGKWRRIWLDKLASPSKTEKSSVVTKSLVFETGIGE